MAIHTPIAIALGQVSVSIGCLGFITICQRIVCALIDCILPTIASSAALKRTVIDVHAIAVVVNVVAGARIYYGLKWLW